METALIVFSSSTSGSRLKNLTQRAGIRNVQITQTPANIKSGGCSYSLRVNLHDIENILYLAARYRVGYAAVYREDKDLSGNKIYVRL
ncbi:MAG: DUF3343 domain-containing protein [Ruminococcaceae bacterium]|nr:DUF3343 domain-containing protein [Oscillospiraceae bacterium]